MAPRESNTIYCPKCKKAVFQVTQATTAHYDPKFKCKHCGHTGVLRWKRGGKL
jgi:predicted Zn finger-like uncharacterized protein